MDERKELVLTVPVQVGTESITVLRFRAAKGRDFRLLPLTPMVGDMLDLGGRLCGQTRPVMDELAPVDVGRVLEIVGESIAGGLPT